MTTFESLGLTEPVLKALKTEGYTVPTPIQAKAVPHVLAGRDLFGCAQTGTGKTAAFALPLIERMMANPRECLCSRPPANWPARSTRASAYMAATLT